MTIRRPAICRTRLFLLAATLVASAHAAGYQESILRDPSYEILSHNAAIRILPEGNVISCTDTLALRIKDRKIRTLTIGLLRFYEVHDVRLNGKAASSRRTGDQVVLGDLPRDTLFTVMISYSGSFPGYSGYSSFTPDRAILREEECLPFGPKAYRSARLTILAPREWTSIAPGARVSEHTAEEMTSTTWEMREPIPLLGWICSGRYVKRSRFDGPVPVSLYLFPEDSSSSPGLPGLADSVLRYYSGQFSAYRFSEFNIVEIGDEIAGPAFLAIAQPSFVMVKKLGFTTDDSYNRAEAVLPHEIAHQWWPVTVYVGEEDNAFLSEGMCEYSSMMYREAAGHPGKRDSLKTHPLLGPLLARALKGEDVPLQMKADLRSLPTHYLKSAFVHNMLRREMGDSLFRLLYREYARRFACRTASLKEFQSLAEELSGRRLGGFFDQWVKKKGIPRLKIYNVKSSREGGAWTTKGRVRMLGYDKFTALIDVGITTRSGVKQERIAIGVDSAGTYRNDVPFNISTAEKPVRATLDPGGDILKMQKIPVKLSDLRDPSDGVMIVGTRRDREYLSSLARRDSVQMERGGWTIRIKYDSSVTLIDLQQEKIFLYGAPAQNSVVEDLGKKFPFGFSGDSIFVRGEKIFDSTLTLIEAIGSSYRAQGIITWIAPLSPKARPQLMPFDASWAVTRGKDEISSGIWEVIDDDLVVEIP